ncbi:MAG TPA: hypothetical protein VJM33_12520 [Microthrixaceae bacterium]|nr:hypothetical protein [Microthrixaceae bacterium]
MTTTNPSSTYSAAPASTELPGSMRTPDPQWLTVQRNAGATPADITTTLVANGWNADQAASWSLRSLRSTDYHHLTYAGVTWMTGIAALSGATSLHYLIDGNPNPVALACAVTFFVSTVPLAVWAMINMRRVEERSAHAVWSPARRLWFATLATCSGLVGLVRLLHFVYIVAASLTGARAEPLDIEAVAQVAVTVGVSLPLFWWSMQEWRHSALLISGLSDDQADDGSRRHTP